MTVDKALSELIDISSRFNQLASNDDEFLCIKYEPLSKKIDGLLDEVLISSLVDLKSLDAKKIQVLQTHLEALAPKGKIQQSLYDELATTGKILKARKAFVEALGDRTAISPSIEHNLDFLFRYFHYYGYCNEDFTFFKKLSQENLTLLLTVLNKVDLAELVHIIVPLVYEVPELVESLFSNIELPVALEELKTIELWAKEFYDIKEISRKVAKLALPTHSSPDLLMHFPGADQTVYQAQFLSTVSRAAELIAVKKQSPDCFAACLDFIAYERNKMAYGFYNPDGVFGIPRHEGLKTLILGHYMKYFGFFLAGSKEGWGRAVEPGEVSYRLKIQREGQKSLKLTKVIAQVVSSHTLLGLESIIVPEWLHTSYKNIKPALKEAERLFNQALSLKVSRDEEGLKAVMDAVSQVHWWLAQAAPFQRGSAAIAKMMAYAVLRHHGIEAGGFGDMEPDCMALIMHPDAFKVFYRGAMKYPAPVWI